MRRREFVALLGSAAVSWPLTARGQQPMAMRRIGILLAYAEGDPEMTERMKAFRQTLERLGWSEARNVTIETRFAPPGGGRERVLAQELVASRPDVILAHAVFNVEALQQESRTIPIVFVGVPDPVYRGFVTSLAQPSGNITGFLSVEASIVGKWLIMLKEIAPDLRRAALVVNKKNFLSARRRTGGFVSFDRACVQPCGERRGHRGHD
jgi:ABC-type uncharacterized transport system substrate-binding protein